MFDVKNFTDNNDIRVINELGPFKVIEFIRDLSVTPQDAQTAYFCN